jgi:hypothetical protein
MRYPISEFFRPGLLNFAVSDDFAPDIGPFGDGGYFPQFNSDLDVIGIDPADEHVYIGQGWAGFEEYDSSNQQVGPPFAGENCPGHGPYPPLDPECHISDYFGLDTIAFDRSGGITDGRIYVEGPEDGQIAAFGPPVIIPDINDVEGTGRHTTAEVSATIGLAGGPEVTDCKLEYGPQAANAGQIATTNYEFTTPCNVAPPYSEDTEIDISLSELLVGEDYHYRFVTTNANGTNTGRDHVFKTYAVLDVATDSASELDLDSAKLNGSLDPDGFATEYFFQYGIDTNYNRKTAKFPIAPTSGVMQVPPVEITGLQPGRTYHYRIVARNSLGTTRGEDRTFVVPASPRISAVRATNVADTTADVNAEIDPFGSETSYRFEYGTSTNYGNTLPDVNIGSGTEPVAVTGHLTGLQSGATYHYRVVASNDWGTSISPDSTFNFHPDTCPNGHVRQQVNASYLPDCRAFELVSPADAGAVQLYPGGVTDGVGGFAFGEEIGIFAPNKLGRASSPARFGFFGGAGAITGLHPPNVLVDRYVSTRTSSGWVTTYPGRPGSETFIAVRPICDVDMDTCMDSEFGDLFGGEEEPRVNHAPHIWDVSGKFLGRWPTNLDVVEGGVAAGKEIRSSLPSADFNHFVFASLEVPFAPGGVEKAPGSVYDNDTTQNTVEIASRLPNGEPIPQDVANDEESLAIQRVSDDGSHILMSSVAPGGTVNLFLRAHGAATYDVAAGHGVKLVGMTATGDQVAFTSPAPLTADDEDSSVDMFVWDEATDSITRASQGNGNGNSDACTGFWTTLCDVRPLVTERPDLDDVMASESGDIYFYSPEQLDPANPGVYNERNLYAYRDGAVKYVATFDPGTEVNRLQISPDGGHSAFLTAARLTAYNNTSPSNLGEPTAWKQIYTFDASNGEVICASCNPSGQPPTIDYDQTGFGFFSLKFKDAIASQSGRFMSDDGRVAFGTADALVPRDTNEKIDVYEFVNNRPYLITTGTSERDYLGAAAIYPSVHTGFEGFSADGVDLYFSTFETLVPQDLNGSFIKFYDARTNGGFPIVPPDLPCSAADECHGDTSSSGSEPLLGTEGALGNGGNALAPKRQAKRAKRRARAKRLRRARQRALRRKQRRERRKQLQKRRNENRHAGPGRG